MILFVTFGIIRSGHAGCIGIRNRVLILLKLLELQGASVTRRRANQFRGPRLTAKVVHDVVLGYGRIRKAGGSVRIGENRLDRSRFGDRFRLGRDVRYTGGPQEGQGPGEGRLPPQRLV